MTGTRWRHKKRGSTYWVVGRAKMQIGQETISGMDTSGLESALLEQMTFVVYRSEADGSLWVRPESEFMDGRFEKIDGSQQA